MGIQVKYKDGVFEPIERVEGERADTIYTLFSEEELRDLGERSAGPRRGLMLTADTSMD